MKRFSVTSRKRGGDSRKKGYKQEPVISNIEWELRPGGMLVQRRSSIVTDSAAAGPMIKIKVSHASYHHDLTVPSQSTFGDLKRVLSNETGLEAKEQRILFRGKEKEDDDYLHMAGVENMSKVVLLQDPASKEKKLVKANETVATIKAQVNKLSHKVVALGRTVESGSKVLDKEFVILTDLLVGQLLKLDEITIIVAVDGGEAKKQWRIEAQRIQSFVDALNSLRKRNSNPRTDSATPKWVETLVNAPITSHSRLGFV